MKRFISVFLVIIIGICSLCACTEEKKPTTPTTQPTETKITYKFGYSCISMDNPYFIELESVLRKELEADEHQFITKDARDDVNLQMEQIQELIDEEVDAVFLVPVDWIEIEPALDLLNEAGIKIINIDTKVQAVDKIDAYIGSDNTAAGELCGQDLIERVPNGGKIIIVECPNRNSINDRIKGFEKEIAKKGFEVVARIDAKGKLDTAVVEVEKVLLENPDVVAIMCGNDPMAIGSLIAANTVVADNLVIYGVDGSPEVKEEITKEYSAIVGTVAQSIQEMADASVEVALQVLEGKKYERITYIETALITKENVLEYGDDGWQ